jgi:tRNA pseudouridine55 synthase
VTNPSADGLIVVDKAGGMTSHDVVARVRRIARTRKVGHAGTLDPMATGVLLLGVGRATRLLTYLVGTDKVYQGTIRLGQATITDDAEGEVISGAPASHLTEEQIRGQLASMTGEVDQVPSSVSAIKVKGVRSYHRVRQGEEVELPARRVTISRIDVGGITTVGELVDVEVEVACSSGTYIRAIARDLGRAMGTGGHLSALRRTQVGNFSLAEAHTLEQLAELETPVSLSLAEALAQTLPVRKITEAEALTVSHGGPLSAYGLAGPYGVFGPDGAALAVMSDRDGKGRPEAVFPLES